MNITQIYVRVPARVNIIGEHTDYNGGFVLPTSTALFTQVAAKPRDDRKLQVTSSTVAEACVFDLDDIQRAITVGWIDYIKGVAAELQLAGIELRGASLEVDSNIPLGAGLSSSASLELSVAKALLAIAGEDMADSELAKLCQRAEHNFAGVRCGIMDQFTLACAKKGHAILLDCRTLRAEQIALPEHAGFILTDSGARHSLTDGDYNNRADECAEAVALLQSVDPAISQLRDLSMDVLEANRASLGDLLFRRCRHVVSENLRVKESVEALEDGDIERLAALIDACHDSLRDDFEVSCDELEALVAAANSSSLVLGSRMVGAGFGGCVLSVCESDDIDMAASEIRANYSKVSGGEPWQHTVSAASPAAVMSGQ
ncbi:MAG: galactokinase [Woeseiaceae bacterium]